MRYDAFTHVLGEMPSRLRGKRLELLVFFVPLQRQTKEATLG